MVDSERIKFNPAVEISYLSTKKQKILYEFMDANLCTPSHAQAIKMKQLEQEGNISGEAIVSIMAEEKPNQVEQYKIPKKSIDRFFAAGTDRKIVEETIVKALDMYMRQRDREGNHDRGEERER